MKKYTIADFDYDLPEELIATEPSSVRDQSRLLLVEHYGADTPNNLKLSDSYFTQLVNLIQPHDLLVFNDSKVIKARLFGQKTTGGKIELLVERILPGGQIIAHVRSNKVINPGLEIMLPGDVRVTVVENLNGLFKLSKDAGMDSGLRRNDAMTVDFWFEYLEQFGHIPLPPYIKRDADVTDSTNYQTVYAKHLGSVAAPTAGLHFTAELIDKIKARGANIAYVTLHVGSGTFKPVSAVNIDEHKMHSEIYSVNQETLDLIRQTHAQGGKIIAVGTTSLRTLETIARDNFEQLHGETDIFITPGFEFKVVDKLITNFHLPKSTLLMLVSAFAGFENIKTVYQHAIAEKYKFFSYGDAMLLERLTLPQLAL